MPRSSAAGFFADVNKNEITKIGDAVFYFAELGMQELRTGEYTADALRKAGFKVEMGIAGMPPAWMATWGSGKPVIAAHTEGDALPNSSQASGVAEQKPISDGGAPGHVEGHNTNLAVLIGGAVAAKRVMGKENIKGTIKLYYLHSREGQKIVSEGGMGSPRKDIVSSAGQFKKSYIGIKYSPEEYEKRYDEWENLMKRLFIRKQ